MFKNWPREAKIGSNIKMIATGCFKWISRAKMCMNTYIEHIIVISLLELRFLTLFGPIMFKKWPRGAKMGSKHRNNDKWMLSMDFSCKNIWVYPYLLSHSHFLME